MGFAIVQYYLASCYLTTIIISLVRKYVTKMKKPKRRATRNVFGVQVFEFSCAIKTNFQMLNILVLIMLLLRQAFSDKVLGNGKIDSIGLKCVHPCSKIF